MTQLYVITVNVIKDYACEWVLRKGNVFSVYTKKTYWVGGTAPWILPTSALEGDVGQHNAAAALALEKGP